MSLNGLDAPATTEAYQKVSHEAAGWFLLQYTNRDSVNLLARGKGGVHEARTAITKYTENSPLYGLIFYRRRKFLIKHIPEGTSRLLQARTAVHVQDILERYSPYETLLEITTADELNDTSLAASFPLHTAASPSVSSNRLHEISEDAEDGPAPRRPSQPDVTKGAIFGTQRYKLEKRVDQIMGTAPGPRPSARLSTLSATRVPPVPSMKYPSTQSSALEDTSSQPMMSLSSSAKSLSSEHAASESSLRQSESSDRTSVDVPFKPTDLTSSSDSPQPMRSSGDSSGKQDDARQSSITDLPRLSASTERTSTDLSISERRKLDDDPYDLSKYDFIPKVKLGPRPVTSEDRTKRPKVASISSIPAPYRPSSGRRSDAHRSQIHSYQSINTPPSTAAMPNISPIPLPPIPNVPEYTPRPVSRGSVKSVQSQKSVMTSEKLRLMKAVELRKRQLRRSTPRLSAVTAADDATSDAAGESEAPVTSAKHLLAPESIAESTLPEEDEEQLQQPVQRKPDSGIEMVYRADGDALPVSADSDPSPEQLQKTSESPKSIPDEAKPIDESAIVSEPILASTTPVNADTHSPVETPADITTSPDAQAPVEEATTPKVERDSNEVAAAAHDEDTLQSTSVLPSESVGETLVDDAINTGSEEKSAERGSVEENASSSNETVREQTIEDTVEESTNGENEGALHLADQPTLDALTNGDDEDALQLADQPTLDALTNGDDEDALQLADQPTLDALHRGIREGLGIVEGDEANLEVPTIVMADGTRPISALVPQKIPAADQVSIYSQASSFEDLQMSARRQDDELARRRRGLVPPLQVEEDSLASDDEFFEELQSATFGEAKPVTVPKSPIGQYFVRRPSGSSLHSLGSVRSVTISPKIPPPSEAHPAQSVAEREASPTAGLNSDSTENLASRRNVSAGISRRIQNLTEASSREPPVFLTAQSTDPRPLTPDAYPDEFRPKERNRLTKAPRGKARGEQQNQQSARTTAAWNAAVQSQQMANGTPDRVVRTSSARESVTVTARIVRSNTTSGIDDANGKMQQPDVIMNYKRASTQHDALPVLDTGLTPFNMDHGNASVSASAPSSRASHRKSWTRHQRSLSPSAEDFPSPPSHSATAGPGSRTSFMLWDDEPVAAAKEGSRTSRFFKRMSTLGSSSKRKSTMPQPSHHETSAGVSQTIPIAETPAAIVVGDLNIQFPDTLLWKRRIVEVDTKGYLTFAIPLALDIQKNSAKKYHLTDFEVPYAPDLDRQELPNSILLDSLDGSITLQVACEDSLSHRQVLNTLRSHWKAWNNVTR